MQEVLGIDVGGSAIKGAPVSVKTGELLEERVRIETPQPSTPEAIVETIAALAGRFGWEGPVGCGFPAVIKDGVVRTAANVDPSNIGFDLQAALRERLGSEAGVINDADAAGLAEVRWGAGREVEGVVLMITVGTGLGTALFVDGRLVPNTELGHIELQGHEAEHIASDAARKRENLKWREWAQRFDAYLRAVEDLLWPDLIIIGGGTSKKAEKFMHRISPRTPVQIARMHNDAGIAGAALAALPEALRSPARAG
ncbi:polyphosphate--glucose phosphotransferase, partial [Rubrobacter xylanophilus]